MTDSAFVILLEVLLSIILVIVVLGNIFVIEAVCRHSLLRTIPNICITSLAIADLFVGLLNVPMYMYAIYNVYGKGYTKDYSMALGSLDMYFGAASILHLAWISMERCYAITFPLRRRLLQKATVIKILAFLWLVAIIPVVLYVLKVPYVQMVILIGYFLIPLIIIITSYTILTISAKISWKKMEEHRVQLVQTTKEFRLAKTLSIVVVVFIVCWTPFFAVLAIYTYPKYFPVHLTSNQQHYIAYFVKIAQYASSAVNPFIYAFRQREFTAALHQLFRTSKTKHGHKALDESCVCEHWSTSMRSSRTIFNRLSKTLERSEHLSLHRTHRQGEKKANSNGQQCSTHV